MRGSHGDEKGKDYQDLARFEHPGHDALTPGFYPLYTIAMQQPDQVLFSAGVTTIGRFRCPTKHPHFEDTGPIRRGYLIVFPRTCVRITYDGQSPVLADPNVVMFYNEGQIYRRGKVSERGDHCEWFAYSKEVLVEALRRYDPSVQERADRPFRLTCGPNDTAAYLLQRLVVEHLVRDAEPDVLFVEEAALSILDRVVNRCYAARGVTEAVPGEATRRAHTEIVEGARELLALRFREPLTLQALAEQLYTSPYHLCRIFRQQTGQTVNRYLHQIRMRTALEEVLEGNPPLSELAIDLGYVSHSHFTLTFRRTFGVLPSRLKRAEAERLLAQADRILVA